MSTIAGTSGSASRLNKKSLFTKNRNRYNLQLSSHEKEINNFLDSNKSTDIIDFSDLNSKDLSRFLKRIDDYDSFFSTAQLENIDFSKFEEHVFFDSAVSKVINSYDRIYNDYPYDKDYFANIDYFSKIDGYTNYILKNNFKRYFGYLNFTSNIKVTIKNQRGFYLNDHSKRDVGFLDPKKRKFSFNFWLLLEETNTLSSSNNQVLFKHFSNSNNNESGFICYLSRESNGSDFDYFINFLLINNGVSIGKKSLVVKESIFTSNEWQSKTKKQKFKNIHISVENVNDTRSIKFFINCHELTSTNINNTSTKLPVENFSSNFSSISNNFVIGNSESLTFNSIDFNNLNNIGIDDFKYFFKKTSKKQTVKYMKKSIYSQKGLALYLKFNEPGGNHNNNNITLDSSGNKLHGLILNNDNTAINDTSNYRDNSISPIVHERKEPSLFASFQENITEFENLIVLAKKYDNINPNIIFKLFPKHYFVESSELQNMSLYVETSNYAPANTGVGIDKKSNTLITNILIMWARFFDSLKCYVDSLSEIINLSYDTINKDVNLGIILPLLCKRSGFDFREILPSPLKSKLDGENLTFEDIKSEKTLRQIQNILWKRLLINSKAFLESKGTKNSIKNIFHSFGVPFDKFVNIREFSSNNIISNLENFKVIEKNINTISFFNEKLSSITPTYSSENSFSNNRPFLEIKSVRYDNQYSFDSDRDKDIILAQHITTGLPDDWSFELFLTYNKLLLRKINNKQSIIRINDNNSPVFNLQAERSNSEKDKFDITLKFIPYTGSIEKQILINDIDLFEGIKYVNISHKLTKIDGNSKIYQTDLYIKDYGFVNNGRILAKNSIVLNYGETIPILKDKNNIDVQIGNYKYSDNPGGLGNIVDTNFDGDICGIRIWKKSLSDSEISSHYSDINNVGTDDLEIDKDLIVDGVVKFEIDDSDIVTTQTDKTVTFKNFKIFKKVLNNNIEEDINSLKLKINNTTSDLKNTNKSAASYSKITSYKIDEPSLENGFNIVSYKEEENKNFNNRFEKFPSYSTLENFDNVKDARVSIEVSSAKFLNEDISRMLSSLNDYTNDLMVSSNLYSYRYNSLDNKRNQYFKLLEKEINNKTLMNFFKYFDNALSNIIKESIPNKVGFLGFNYVYESHILERSKYEYKMSDSRLAINDENKYNHNRELPNVYRNKEYKNNRVLSEK